MKHRFIFTMDAHVFYNSERLFVSSEHWSRKSGMLSEAPDGSILTAKTET